MPKLIDHSQRREELAEATWRVILTQGISHVSIRTVAAEAGISTGSLRHVFPSKAELLTYAMELANERAWARITPHLGNPDVRAGVLAVIKELLPLDAERRREMEINLALIAEAPDSEDIRIIRDENYQAIREGIGNLVGSLHRAGLIDPDLDLEVATTTLYALIDGLAMHLLVSPDSAFPQTAVNIIESYIDSL